MTTLLIPPATLPPGTQSYEWIDPAGVVRSLSNLSSIVVESQIRGLGSLGPELTSDKLPFASGTLVRHAAVPARVIEVPLLLQAASPTDLEMLLDSVHGWFATASEARRTPGYFRVTRRDGTQRQVACYYQRGLEGDLAPSEAGPTWQKHTVELVAPDPYGTAVEDTVQSYLFGTSATFTVINAGQIEAYPRWAISGPTSGPPITGITIANLTTQRAWSLLLTIPTGDTIYVDTRPASQRTTLAVTDQDGVNHYAGLTAQSDLWWLAPANNSIAFASANATTPFFVELTYLPRYRSLLR